MLRIALFTLVFASTTTFGGIVNGADTREIASAEAPDTVLVELPDLRGEWSGEWCSRSTGHRGPMKATFCRINCNQYEVTFKGRFCTLIPFRYTAILTASPGAEGQVVLTGSKNLGLLFGTFRFQGSANDCRINANYCSKDDRGHFRLARISR